MIDKRENQYSEQETVARREAALKRMLSTPHQPQKSRAKKKARVEKKAKPSR
jgi:hypothetical protein